MEAITTSLMTTLFPFFLLFTTSLQVITLAQQNSTTQDPYAMLHLIRNSDGSLTRPVKYFPTVPPNTSALSFSKDAPLNPAENTWVRLYLPNGSDHPRPGKLPILVFGHRGGFVILSPDNPTVDTLCSEASKRVGALVVSVNYRLAPEHRLSGAYDGVLEALTCVKEEKDEWDREYGDLSRCVLMEESAGGNIAYTVGLKVSALVNDFKPLIIKGLVLIQGKNSRESGLTVGLIGCDGDPLFDRQVELVKLIERRKVNVIANFSEGGYHGVFSKEIDKAAVVFEVVRRV